MKYLALLLFAALLSACDTSEEDSFFYKGWMHPERDANKRIYGGDVNREKVTPAETLPPPL